MSLTLRAWAALVVPLAATCLHTSEARATEVSVQVRAGVGKPLGDAVVFLESREAKAAARVMRGVEVAQIERRFVPAVTVVTLGTEVQFPNRDKVRHHVYSFSSSKSFELKLYTGTPANPVLFDRPGIVVMGCNIHDDMAAWVVVVETPYFGKTGVGGQVQLVDVPQGHYRLRVWHPGRPVGSAALDQALSVGAQALTVPVQLDNVKP